MSDTESDGCVRYSGYEIAAQLARFNRERKAQFGRAPRSEEPLPLPSTGRGGDVEQQE